MMGLDAVNADSLGNANQLGPGQIAGIPNNGMTLAITLGDTAFVVSVTRASVFP
jgi:hypothetical protein